MFQVTITKAELWGNFRDGFDNNGNYRIARFETDEELESTELSPGIIEKIAREYFAGYSFPLTEAGNNFIGRNSKAISVEWAGSGDLNTCYDVFYRGQYIGEN